MRTQVGHRAALVIFLVGTSTLLEGYIIVFILRVVQLDAVEILRIRVEVSNVITPLNMFGFRICATLAIWGTLQALSMAFASLILIIQSDLSISDALKHYDIF